MRKIQQVAYILLYLQFFVRDVFTLDLGVLLEEKISTNDITRINNWKCDSDNECTATGSKCKDQECQCAPGYIYNSKMTSCIRIADGLHDSCEDSLQCSAYLLSGGVCLDNICVCSPGYYYLHGRCNRYVGLSEKCERNVDCHVNADFEASTCNTSKKICECSPGFYQREYRTCRREGKAVGDECTIDLDCTFKNATCRDFICIEQSEFKETVEFSTDIILTAVVNKSTEIRVGSNCTTNEDCSELGNATCDLTGTCRCVRAHFAPYEDAKCIPELGESCGNEDVPGIENSICPAGIWRCTSGTVASKDNRECRKATTEYGGECYENEDCYVFGPDAKCEENACVCNTNSHYVESELFCWGNKGINETCVQEHDCYVEGFKGKLKCKDGTCGCPDDTRLNKNRTTCINSMGGIGDVCAADEDCVIEDAICNKEVCDCKEYYHPSRNRRKCLAGVNATCEVDKQCVHVSNSACISEVCSCKQNHVPAAVDTCLPIIKYNQSCSHDVQCSNIPGAFCASVNQDSENKVCTCGGKDQHRFGKCFKKKMLGETCTNVGECYLNFNLDAVMCMNGKCTCNWGFMKQNNSVCLKDKRSTHFLNDGVIKVASTGLFSVALLLASLL